MNNVNNAIENPRQEILESLERARPPQVAAPPAMTAPADPGDPFDTLRARVEEAGGFFQSCAGGDWAAQRAIRSTPIPSVARAFGGRMSRLDRL